MPNFSEMELDSEVWIRTSRFQNAWIDCSQTSSDEGFPKEFNVWESHNDEVHKMPNGFRILASSDACQVQVMQHETLPYAGVQYHPEVENTEFGAEIFQNFLDKALEWNK